MKYTVYFEFKLVECVREYVVIFVCVCVCVCKMQLQAVLFYGYITSLHFTSLH
jgi:hypothetical protein